MRGPIQRTPPRRGSPEGARPGHQTTEADAKRSDGRHRRHANSRQTPAPNEQLAEAGAKSRQSPFVGNYEEASTTGNPNSGRSPCFVTAVKFTTVTKQDISGARYRNRKEEPAGRCIHIHNTYMPACRTRTDSSQETF